MYDMDELEIQKKILIDITSRELKEEKDKWHRKYNDAEIEISRLKREVDSLISAVKTLIKERDYAIADIKTLFNDGDCDVCYYGDVDCIDGGECKWRGDFEEAEKMNGVEIIREYPQPTNMNDWCGNGEKR